MEAIKRPVGRFVAPWRDEQRLVAAWNAVQEDLARPWTLDALSSVANIRKEHLRQLCQHSLGRSPMQQLTDLPVKVSLPGPYLLTRSMWVTAHSKTGPNNNTGYNDKTEMGEDVVQILREELIELRDAGASFVQFDEPVLTEIVMSDESGRRTFM